MKLTGGIAIIFFVVLCGCTSPSVQQYVAFQDNWETIPKNFKSDGIIDMTKVLSERKSDYESTADYNKRIREFAETRRELIFITGLEQKYNADLQQYDFEILNNSRAINFSQKNHVKIRTFRPTSSVDQRTWNYSTIDFYINLHNFDASRYKYSSRKTVYKTNVKMSSLEAQRVGNRFKALFVVKLTSDDSGDYKKDTWGYKINSYCNYYDGSPQTRLAYDYWMHGLSSKSNSEYCINVTLKSIWIYDEITGKVYSKYYPDVHSLSSTVPDTSKSVYKY